MFGVAACGSGTTPTDANAPGSARASASVSVMTSTTVFADMVRQVGGDLVDAQSLVPANGDVHTFAAKPSDLTRLARARLVVMNGLGLDDWLDRTITSVASGATVLKL